MAVSQSLSVTEVADSISTANNTSKVKIVWTSTQSGESYNLYTKTAYYWVSINGEAETKYSVTYTLPKGTTKTIVEKTITVTHKDDGSGSVKVRTWMDTGISAGEVEKSKTLTLTTIARASTISSASDVTLGNSCSVKWTPKSASFRYKLKFSLGDWSYTTGAIHPNKTSSYTYSGYKIPIEVADEVTTKTGTMKVTLYSYSNSGATKQIGSTDSETFKVTVPETDDTRPTVSSMSVAPVSTLASPFNGLYIQGHSKVKATLDFETKYNATVSASNITVEGANYESPYESAILNQPGVVSVKATVKDSRGYYGTNYKDIEVLEYGKPYVRAKSNESEIVVARCDSSAALTDTGTYLKIKAKVVWSKLISNNVQHNYAKIKFRYRKEGGSFSDWQTILDSKTNNTDEIITAPLLNGALDTKSNYQVQVIATDDLYDSDPVTFSIPSENVYMDRPAGGKSMALGGYSTGDNIFDLYWRLKARDGMSLIDAKGTEIPLDSTLPIPRDQVASGWNPDNLDCGVYVVAKNIALKTGETVIMYNGVLIQMAGDVGQNVKIQIALPIDEGRNPMYRLCWYSNWSTWRSMKL